MKQVKETLTGFFLAIGIYAAVVEVIGIFFSENLLSYTLGLLFGVAVAVLLILHMTKTLDRALDLPEAQANKYVRKQSFLRLVIMLAAMIIALSTEWFNFITVIIGLLSLKLGALFAPFFLKRLYPDSYVTKESDEVTE